MHLVTMDVEQDNDQCDSAIEPSPTELMHASPCKSDLSNKVCLNDEIHSKVSLVLLE